jgi:hypothetical protein
MHSEGALRGKGIEVRRRGRLEFGEPTFRVGKAAEAIEDHEKD